MCLPIRCVMLPLERAVALEGRIHYREKAVNQARLAPHISPHASSSNCSQHTFSQSIVGDYLIIYRALTELASSGLLSLSTATCKRGGHRRDPHERISLTTRTHSKMDVLPFVRPRTTDGLLGYLNYPPEIMNKIYHELHVDNSQIFVFLCSSDPQHCILGLKRAVALHQSPHYDLLEWAQLFDERYYTSSNGISGQFLRVCRKICLEGSPVLYGNLTVAMRRDMRWVTRYGLHWNSRCGRIQPDGQHVGQHAPPPDPCISRFFRRNTPFLAAWAAFVYPKHVAPLSTPGPNGDSIWSHILHWGMNHWTAPKDSRERILQRLHTDMSKREHYGKHAACA